MSSDSAIIDFTDSEARRIFIGYVKNLRGPHRVSIHKERANRSSPQNRWYWGCIVPRVAAGLEECWGEKMSHDETHEWLKAKFNSRVMVNRKSGEVVGRTPQSTATLDVAQFSEFVEKVIRFAGESLGIEIPQPSTV